MSKDKVFYLKKYALACSVRQLDDGHFQPALVVSRTTWPRRPTVIALRHGAFVTEALAMTAAHAQGREWVTVHGENS